MSSSHNTAQLVPFRAGHDPRRNPGGVTAAERAFKAALDAEHIPKASALLSSVYEQALAGDARMAELFFKVCGLIRKPTDDATIQATAAALLTGMIEEAKARRANGG